jgi:DNA-binding CsgD family transcriptional regulator
MLNLLAYIVFFFSVAFASAGIIFGARLRSRYKAEYFSALFYYQVFIFTFGFYGIWGQAVIRTFLSGLVSAELLERFLDISVLLGMPFLVFAWLMLLRFSREVSGRKRNNWFVLWFLLLNFLALLGIGILIAGENKFKPVMLIRYYFICFSIIYTISSSLLILFPGHNKPVLQKYESRILAFAIILIAVCQSLALGFYKENQLTGLLFVFLFFAGNSFLPLYINYGTVLSLFMTEPGKDISFEEFCRKFEVSPRESEIIREICNGLSNKEIADKLFISLQTVKDHTHRIYIKTNVKSRAQLMTLIKEIKQ